MKANFIGNQHILADYVFADVRGIDYSKWLRRLFWATIHTMTLFFIVSALLSYTGTRLSSTKAIQSPQVTAVASAVQFPAHDTAPDPNSILDLVNQKRISIGLAPLVADAQLGALAESRATDMVTRSYYAHKNPDGEIFYDLLKKQGSEPRFACENLSLESSSSINTSVDSWMASSQGHKECMLDPTVSLAGYASIKMYDASVNGVMQPYYVVVAIHSTQN